MRSHRSATRHPRHSAPSVRKPRAAVPDFIDSSLVPPRALLDDALATQQMASDMREGAYREGGVSRDGLELLGYTAAQIDGLASAARALANQQAGMT